jgi:hypothetical protein
VSALHHRPELFKDLIGQKPNQRRRISGHHQATSRQGSAPGARPASSGWRQRRAVPLADQVRLMRDGVITGDEVERIVRGRNHGVVSFTQPGRSLRETSH